MFTKEKVIRINKENDLVFLSSVRRLVVKIGSSTLTHPSGKLNLFRLEHLVREIADLKHRGLEIILVTSGAVSAGLGKLSLIDKPENIPEKQALASIGQGLLMHMYEKLFTEYGQIVAQVLLTREDFMQQERCRNARNTLLTLLRYQAIPIINENDTVAFEEIKFGDNDTLAALLAGLLTADLLILLSDIDGLYTADPHQEINAELIKVVRRLTPEILALAGGTGTRRGSGGMITKLEAAKIAGNAGIPMLLVNGSRGGVLGEIMRGHNPGTLFLAGNDQIEE